MRGKREEAAHSAPTASNEATDAPRAHHRRGVGDLLRVAVGPVFDRHEDGFLEGIRRLFSGCAEMSCLDALEAATVLRYL